jgi:uncharacterized protein
MLIRILLIGAVVLLVIWWLRGGRRARASTPAPRPAAPPASVPEAMQVCAHCGVHVPGSELVAGQRGVYCSLAHRLASEPDQP